MKPFNLEDAIHGEPVITRNGEDYTFGAYNPHAQPQQKIVGWTKEGVHLSHREDGKFLLSGVEHRYDLFMKPAEKQLWIGVRRTTTEGLHSVTAAYDEEDKVRKAILPRIHSYDYEIIPITIHV